MITHTAYIEAFAHEQQRSPRLRDFHIDPNGAIRHYTHTVVIPLIGKQGRWTLTLPLKDSFALNERIISQRCILTERPDNPFVAAEYIPRALTLFDSAGRCHIRSGLLQEAFTPIVEFIRLNNSSKRNSRIRVAIESIAQAARQGLQHGDLNKYRVCFNENGDLRITDYPIVDSDHRHDCEMLGKLALLLYIGASDINSFKALMEKNHKTEEDKLRTTRSILSAAEFHGFTKVATLCSALLSKASALTIGTNIGLLSREKFAPMELLLPLILGHKTRESIIYRDGLIPPVVERQLRVDFSLCDTIEMASDQIVRYSRGGRWGYAYSDGEVIPIEREIVAAYDFVEGRAVIRTPRGYGMVDTKGHLVMNDVWEQMCWYGDENVAVAADQMGRWFIYDRQGRQLSAIACDWMGDASEGFVVARRGDRFGYFGIDGRRHTDFIYDEAFSFSEGRALVRRKGEYFHIDTSFHRVIE